MFLEKFAINLNKTVSNANKLLIGRENEMRLLCQVLCRYEKSNPILIGSPGVGKSAIIEGLAIKINSKQVPNFLINKIIYSLNIAALKAGTKFRGELEERLSNLIKELENNNNIILFIDEIHLITQDDNNSLNISNILKPVLTKKDIRIIGATTSSEYKKFIEQDGAFKRRFTEIHINEPTINESIAILQGIKIHYEEHYGIDITNKAINSAVVLSSKYIGNRYLPDKAVDIIDESCAMLKLDIETVPDEIVLIEKKISNCVLEIQKIKYDLDISDSDNNVNEEIKSLEINLNEFKNIRDQKYKVWHEEKNKINLLKKLKIEKSKLLKDQQDLQMRGEFTLMGKIMYDDLPKLNKQIINLENEAKNFSLKINLTSQDVSKLISKKSGIPVDIINLEDRKKMINNMESFLNSTIIDQQESIKEFCQSIKGPLSGIKFDNRPLGCFLFVGPTGVGKTELAKNIKKFLFGDSEESILILDMSEFSEKHSVSSLIGSPPGYIGYNENARLVDAIIRRPHRVIILDEIEKAHSSIFNVLLQIMDRGEMHDTSGRLAKFNQSIIIMTSNIGQNLFFKYSNNDIGLKKLVLREINLSFKSEFLNRLDNIIIFNKLNSGSAFNITKMHLERFLYSFYKQYGINVTYEDNVINLIVEFGYNERFGAREIIRNINKIISSKLSDYILSDSKQFLNLKLKANNKEIEVNLV